MTPRKDEPAVRHDVSRLTDDDLYLFNEGTHHRLYEKLGAHPMYLDGAAGTCFAVWAPNAREVSVIGDFNGWQRGRLPLRERGTSGIWEGFIVGVGAGALYKYFIASHFNNYSVEKADPFAFFSEVPPRTASVVRDLDYKWGDGAWMEKRRGANSLDAPVSVYEVHLGSWRRVPEEGNRSLTYREIAPLLADYANRMGFTHVEFLPVMEHPFYGSWGYQTTGYFAPTSRYGAPQDFMYLVDHLHRRGIGVILDWVPSHFPNDEFALGYFDGTHLYEHADPVQGIHPDWNSFVFNYGRTEVRSFLHSSAVFWLEKYHADGLRVDAVASMLYLDYGRQSGRWVPNRFGGRENLEAIDFLKKFNETAYAARPDIQTIAEESTAWPMVSRPTYAGGLGFGMKWDMGWMHDTLVYITRDPIYRRYHQNDLTFRMVYAFTENFVLPLSHDEVVYGKASLLSKMPGEDWQKFANLRLLLGYMYAQPGKKLLFMGGEFGQRREWSHEESLEWHLLQYAPHQGLRQWVADLNALYRDEPALHVDFDPAGFQWIDAGDYQQSIISFIRRGRDPEDIIVFVGNFTPQTHFKYEIGVPRAGTWREVLNGDTERFGGSGQVNGRAIRTRKQPRHGQPYSLSLKIPPLAGMFLKPGHISSPPEVED
jgi:1,4-alpha-glucan branching enzyme